jgi:hypothetical protein
MAQEFDIPVSEFRRLPESCRTQDLFLLVDKPDFSEFPPSEDAKRLQKIQYGVVDRNRIRQGGRYRILQHHSAVGFQKTEPGITDRVCFLYFNHVGTIPNMKSLATNELFSQTN